MDDAISQELPESSNFDGYMFDLPSGLAESLQSRVGILQSLRQGLGAVQARLSLFGKPLPVRGGHRRDSDVSLQEFERP